MISFPVVWPLLNLIHPLDEHVGILPMSQPDSGEVSVSGTWAWLGWREPAPRIPKSGGES